MGPIPPGAAKVVVRLRRVRCARLTFIGTTVFAAFYWVVTLLHRAPVMLNRAARIMSENKALVEEPESTIPRHTLLIIQPQILSYIPGSHEVNESKSAVLERVLQGTRA